jgi:hypothetical protein
MCPLFERIIGYSWRPTSGTSIRMNHRGALIDREPYEELLRLVKEAFDATAYLPLLEVDLPAISMDLSQIRAICEAAMLGSGMPARIRTANGAPPASTGLLGLSKLPLGWMKLGIVHECIQAGPTATKRSP